MPPLPQYTSPTVVALDDAAADAQSPRDGQRIGPSAIGHPCERNVWLSFRWASEPERFDGRMLRLFGTGHLYEDRLVEALTQAGMTVRAVGEDGRQIPIEYADGHGYGKLDGEVLGVPDAPTTWHVLEIKTHNQTSFNRLKKVGVAEHKPEHVAQMQLYMHGRGRTRALYLAVCKNDDELYAERIEYDPVAATQLVAKAERVRGNAFAPQKINDTDTYPCTFCRHKALCHEGAWGRRNCRTCIHSTAAGGGRWKCERHDIILSVGDQAAGCGNHRYLPDMVPGRQVDVAGDAVTYELADGERWTDGAP